MNPVAITLVATLGLLALGASGSARANGGTLRLARVEAGPYLVSAWTQPDPPRVGQFDVSVAVMRPQDGTPVLDVATTVAAQHADDPTSRVSGPAVRGGGGNFLLYHAELELPQPGRWRVSVAVQAPAGQGSASFEVDAVQGVPLTPLLIAGAAAVLLAWILRRHFVRGARPPLLVLSVFVTGFGTGVGRSRAAVGTRRQGAHAHRRSCQPRRTGAGC